jgi:hypothetical protein
MNSAPSIQYFGYGPIVNEMVRKRRNIRVSRIRAAYIDDYALSFEFGGVANIVRKRGYRVHGLLMTLSSLQDWKRLQSFDIGRRVSTRTVVHYPTDHRSVEFFTNCLDEDEEKEEMNRSEAYTIEFPEDVQSTLYDVEQLRIERSPQEGYLKLIADGMQQHRVNFEYIQDEILNIPFIPDRSVKDYNKFPMARNVRKISFPTYQQLCDRSRRQGIILFILGDSVFRLGEHDPNNPLVKWLEEHGHGKGDCTFFVQLTLMDPGIPFCDTKADVTPYLIEWAENKLVGYIGQHGLSASKVFQIAKDGNLEETTSLSSISSSGKSSGVEQRNSRSRPNKISNFWRKMNQRHR